MRTFNYWSPCVFIDHYLYLTTSWAGPSFGVAGGPWPGPGPLVRSLLALRDLLVVP